MMKWSTYQETEIQMCMHKQHRFKVHETKFIKQEKEIDISIAMIGNINTPFQH